MIHVRGVLCRRDSFCGSTEFHLEQVVAWGHGLFTDVSMLGLLV